MAYRTLRGGVCGLGAPPYSDLSGGGGHHGGGHGGGGFRGGWGGGGWYGPAWEAPDYTFVNNGPRVMDCYRDAQGNLILGVPSATSGLKRGKCLVDAGGNVLNMLPTPVNGLGSIFGRVRKTAAIVTGPLDRAMPAPLANRIPTRVTQVIGAATGNPLLAARVRRMPAPRAVNVPTGYVVTGASETSAVAAPQTFPGRAIVVGTPSGKSMVRMSWRNDNPPINRARVGEGERVIECVVDASGNFVRAMGTPINGLGAWLSGVPVTPGSSINQPAAPAVIPTAVAGPPPNAITITQGLAIDPSRGDIWVGPTKVPILPAVLSAVVVKVIMFGGSAAGGYVAGRFSRKKAT